MSNNFAHVKVLQKKTQKEEETSLLTLSQLYNWRTLESALPQNKLHMLWSHIDLDSILVMNMLSLIAYPNRCVSW
jgi:hypothetical protein